MFNKFIFIPNDKIESVAYEIYILMYYSLYFICMFGSLHIDL